VWRIDAHALSGRTLEDTYFPGWDFNDMTTWTEALLGHGGVAWCKLFDSPNASYGTHNGVVAFWNKDSRAGLRIVPQIYPSTSWRPDSLASRAVCSHSTIPWPMPTFMPEAWSLVF
jgi:hypothetical protein